MPDMSFEGQQAVNACCCITGSEPACAPLPSPLPPAADVSVTACPALPGYGGAVLLPANTDAVALITYHGTPGAQINAWMSEAPAEMVFGLGNRDSTSLLQNLTYFRSPTANKPFTFQIGDKGTANIAFQLTIREGVRKLAGAVKATISLQEANGPLQGVEVYLGVGVGVVDARLVRVVAEPQDSSDGGTVPNHLWRATVKSRFFPDLDLADYAASFAACDANLPHPVVNVQSIVISEGAKTQLIDGIGGKGDDFPPDALFHVNVGQTFEFKHDPMARTYLAPSDARRGELQPYARYGENFYAGVIQKSSGNFSKGYFALLRVDDKDGAFAFSQASLEPRVMDGQIYTFSVDAPESIFMSGLCVYNKPTFEQMVMLKTLEMIPKAGSVVELWVNLNQFTCDILNGNNAAAASLLATESAKEAVMAFFGKVVIPSIAQGRFSDKFYRLMNVDPKSVNPAGAAEVADHMRGGLTVVAKKLEMLTWSAE
jgi:hypothetical protein